MAVYTKVEFGNLCRLCISFSDNNLDILSDSLNSSDLKCKISDCLSIQINDNDPLPKKICNTCLEKLESFDEFRKICCNSESTLQCYYSLFKSTIDSDGTIFIKANGIESPKRTTNESDVVSTTTTNIIPVNYVEDGIIISDGIHQNAGVSTVALFSRTSTVSSSIESIPLCSATENGIISTDCNIGENLVECHSTVISGSSNPLVQPLTPSFQFVNQVEQASSNQVASLTNIVAVDEALQFADNKEDIVILEGNKCNLLNFIDPNAQIYMVNVDVEGKLVAHQVQTDISQEVGFPVESVLDQALSSPIPVRNEPVLDQQGIENISEFLRNIYPSENSKILDKCNEDSDERVSMEFIEDSDCNNGAVVKDVVDMASTVAPSDETKDFVELVALAPTPEDILLNLPIQTSEGPVSEVGYDSTSQDDLDVTNSQDFTSLTTMTDEITNSCNDGLNINNSELNVEQVVQDSEPLIIEQLNITDEPTMKKSSDDTSSDQLSNSASEMQQTPKKNKIKPKTKFPQRLSKQKKQKPIPNTEGNQCLICNKIFDNRRKLRIHVNAHEEKTYPCPYCNKCYGRNWHRNRHIGKSHNPLEPLNKEEFICNICSKEYSRKDYLRKHMLTHNQVYACDKCNAILETEANFKKHKATNCLGKETCSECGAEFDSKTFYLQHINSNCGKNTVEDSPKLKLPSIRCTLCGMKFFSKWRFKHHMERHKRVSPLKNNFISGKVILNTNDKARDQYLTDKFKLSRIVLKKIDHSKVKNNLPHDQGVVSSCFNKDSSCLTKMSGVNSESTNHAPGHNVDANETKNTSLPPVHQKSVKPSSSQNVDVTFGQFIKDLLKRPSIHRKNIHAFLDSIATRKLGKSADANKTTSEPHGSKDLEFCSQKFLEDKKKENLKLETSNEISGSNSSIVRFESQQESEAINTVVSVPLEPIKSLTDSSSNKQIEKHKDFSSSLTERQIDDFVFKLVQSLNDDSSLPTDEIAFQSRKKENKLLVTETSQRDHHLENKFLSTLEEGYRKYRQMARDDAQEVVVQEQTKDLVMKINDNLPDTLLTVLPNLGKPDVKNIDKQTLAAERVPKNFLDESVSAFECTLDNLLDAPETSSAENDLENILKEAVKTLGDCGPVNFSDEAAASSIKSYDESLVEKSMDDVRKQSPKQTEPPLDTPTNLEPLNDFHKEAQPQGESLNGPSCTIISTYEEADKESLVELSEEVKTYTLVKDPLSILETSNAEVSATRLNSSEGLIEMSSTAFELCETNSLILTKPGEGLSKPSTLEKNSKVVKEEISLDHDQYFSKDESDDIKDLDGQSSNLDKADGPLMVPPYIHKDGISHFNSSFISSTENFSPINLVEKVSPVVKIAEGNLAGDATIVSNNKESSLMKDSTNSMLSRKDISNKNFSHKAISLVKTAVPTSRSAANSLTDSVGYTSGKDQGHSLENDLPPLSPKADEVIVLEETSVEVTSLGVDAVAAENSQLQSEAITVKCESDDVSTASSFIKDDKCPRTESKRFPIDHCPSLDGAIELPVETPDGSVENVGVKECVSAVEGSLKEEIKSYLGEEVIKKEVLTNGNYGPHCRVACNQILSDSSQKMITPVVRIAQADLPLEAIILDKKVVAKPENSSLGSSFIHHLRRKRSYNQDSSDSEGEKLNYISNKSVSNGNDEEKLLGFNSGQDLDNCVVQLTMIEHDSLHHPWLEEEENDVRTIDISETTILKSPTRKSVGKMKRKPACRMCEDTAALKKKYIKSSDFNKSHGSDSFLELKNRADGPLKGQNINSSPELNSCQPMSRLITLSDSRKLGVSATNKIKSSLREDLGENESVCGTTNKKSLLVGNDHKKKHKIKKDQTEYMKEFDIRECSIKIPQLGESMLYNNSIVKMEKTSEVTNNACPPNEDRFTDTSARTKDASDEDSPKESFRTIKILLERFDPQKMSHYSGKNQCKMSVSPACISQPYNLRKAKEVQTYICTMEDS